MDWFGLIRCVPKCARTNMTLIRHCHALPPKAINSHEVSQEKSSVFDNILLYIACLYVVMPHCLSTITCSPFIGRIGGRASKSKIPSQHHMYALFCYCYV